MSYAMDIVGAEYDAVGDVLDDLLADDSAGAISPQAFRRGVKTKVNRVLRRFPIGLGATSVAAAATLTISVNPQLPFKIERLLIPGSAGLLITDLKVGTVSQFVAPGSIPVEVFAADSIGVFLKGDTAVPGVNIDLTVNNPTGGAIVLSGAYIGVALQ